MILQESEQVVRILSAFALALGIIYLTAKLIGEEKKAAWFRKRQCTTIFTRRGFLGETWNFGLPLTWQGVAAVCGMYGVIALLSYIVVFII